MNFVRAEHDQNVAVLTLSRGKVNAINDQLVDELQVAVANATADDRVRAVVLASDKPNFFSTGFDVTEVFQYERGKMIEFFGKYVSLYESIYTLSKPVVGAISGHAFAGGAILALACDVRIMAEGEFGFALNEVDIGVVLPVGVARMAIDAVGVPKARELILSGTAVTPAQALEIGLAKELAPPELVLERALWQARAFAAKPPVAFAGIKRLLREVSGHYNVEDDKKTLDTVIDSWFSSEAKERKKALTDSLRKVSR